MGVPGKTGRHDPPGKPGTREQIPEGIDEVIRLLRGFFSVFPSGRIEKIVRLSWG
jgi:hypothetical protein